MALSSLGAQGTLSAALARLEFVQYDPIHRPAAAQDLVLRHRVRGYRAGDLFRNYEKLGLDEGYLHVYGAMSRRLSELATPPSPRGPRKATFRPTGLVREVLEFVSDGRQVTARDVSARFGMTRTQNVWGGISAETTQALALLQWHGLIRVAGRRGGTKIYERRPATANVDRLGENERLRELMYHVVKLLAPISEGSIRATLSQLIDASGVFGDRRAVFNELTSSSRLESATVDGVVYFWPAGRRRRAPASGDTKVRLFAPFDPVVWDRRRFLHLMGWPYRFEAYTPAATRRFGYYALPLFYGDRAIGWAECERRTRFDVRLHFVAGRPRERAFRASLDEELASLEWSTTAEPIARTKQRGERAT